MTTEILATGLERPVWVGSPPQDDRIFVIEQYMGTIRIIEDGAVVDDPFLDIHHLIAADSDRGFLGMAFHPGFAQNGLFFVSYVDLTDHSTIARYRVSTTDPNLADLTSEEVLLTLEQPHLNHNGGHLMFHPIDGYLYIPFGDGGGANDPDCRSQDPNYWYGKLLRIDVDGGSPYAIPPDNPLGDEIFARGLRSPWRIAFDRANGDMYIGDVGQSLREEVSYVEAPLPPGLNFGWPSMEGDVCRQENVDKCELQGAISPDCFAPSLVDPIHSYVNGDEPLGQGHCVIGGVVYRGCAIPEMHGAYLFADNHSGRFWTFRVVDGVKTEFQERTLELQGAGPRPTHFGTDPKGEILVADVLAGTVARILPADPELLADCDADGQDDLCEVTADSWKDVDADGTLDSCESFSSDAATVSIGAGGLQNLALHAGAEHANAIYLILGSLSGTTPGIDLGSLVLPLNPDPYLELSLTAPNNIVPFTDSLGQLDAQGEAHAQIYVLPGVFPASVIGQVAQHVYVLVDPTPTVNFVSNNTAVRFQS